MARPLRLGSLASQELLNHLAQADIPERVIRAALVDQTLPRAFFAGNPKQITLNWIDFYRN
jgi:hypothetical protein